MASVVGPWHVYLQGWRTLAEDAFTSRLAALRSETARLEALAAACAEAPGLRVAAAWAVAHGDLARVQACFDLRKALDPFFASAEMQRRRDLEALAAGPPCAARSAAQREQEQLQTYTTTALTMLKADLLDIRETMEIVLRNRAEGVPDVHELENVLDVNDLSDADVTARCRQLCARGDALLAGIDAHFVAQYVEFDR